MALFVPTMFTKGLVSSFVACVCYFDLCSEIQFITNNISFEGFLAMKYISVQLNAKLCLFAWK